MQQEGEHCRDSGGIELISGFHGVKTEKELHQNQQEFRVHAHQLTVRRMIKCGESRGAGTQGGREESMGETKGQRRRKKQGREEGMTE